MRVDVAPPLVPDNKFRTLPDDRHFDQSEKPVLKNPILRRSQQAPPDAASLKIRQDGEHAEISTLGLLLQKDVSDQILSVPRCISKIALLFTEIRLRSVSGSVLCPPRRPASVVQPRLLASPR